MLLFILSILVSLISAIPALLAITGNKSGEETSPYLERAIEDGTEIFQDKTLSSELKTERLKEVFGVIVREQKRSEILSADSIVSVYALIISFLILQAALLAGMFFAILRIWTKQWEILNRGMVRLQRGELSFRMPSLKGKEFGAFGGEINKLLDLIEQKEEILRGQAKLLGWKEVGSFISHQLKNPLSTINISADLLAKPALERDKIDETVRYIREESQKLKELLDRLNDITRMPELKPEIMEIGRYFIQLKQVWSGGGIDLTIVHRDPQAHAKIDAQLLNQTFFNLFQNSMEACSSGKPNIDIETGKAGRAIEIVYSDSNQDVSDTILKSLFNPRFTTKKKGFGIGLTIAKNIIVMHEGVIEAKLNEKGGLVFSMLLPLVEIENE